MSNEASPPIAGPNENWPDLFARTSDGGHIIVSGGDARRLADAIKAVVNGEAVIVPLPLPTLWKRTGP